MRLTSLTMQDFRCFRGSRTIDLAADVVAIYGRNGSGKTTVFDAIEFALLGEIGRFASEPQRLSYLPNALGSALPAVRVDYDDSEPGHVRAHLQPDGSIALSPNWSNHRDLLYGWLVQDGYQPARREVSAVRDLFRASVLLSQWSIRRYVEAPPAERASVLAHIAGVPYLQRCLEKVQEVHRLAGWRATQADTQSQDLAEQLQTVAADLAATENRRKAILARLDHKNVALDDLARAMAAAQLTLRATAATQHPEEIAAGAIALCREALADLDRRDRALAELELVAQGHRERVAQRQQLSKDLGSFQGAAAQLDTRAADLSGAIESAQARVRAAGRTLEDVSGRLVALDELAQIQTQLAGQREQLRSVQQRQADLQNALQATRVKLTNLSATADTAEADRRTLLGSRDGAMSSLSNLRRLRASLAPYRSDVDNLSSCDARLVQLERELKVLQERRAQLQQTQDALNGRLVAAQRRHNELTSAQQRKTSLVASLREYATGEHCPMCGTRHATPKALVEAIEHQLQAAPRDIRDLARQIETDRAELQAAQSEIRLANESIVRCEEGRRAVSTERATLVSRIAVQDHLAEQAGTIMEREPLEQAISALDARLGEVGRTLEAFAAEIRRLSQEKNQVEVAIGEYEPALADENQKLAAGQLVITRLQRRTADLGIEEAATGSAQELAKTRVHVEKQREATRAQKSNDERELTRVTQEWTSVREARERVERDLNQCVNTLARVTEALHRTERLCQQLAIETQDPEEAAKSLREGLADVRERVNLAANTAEQYQWSSAVGALSEQEVPLRRRHEELKTNVAVLADERHRLEGARQIAGRWSDTLRREVTRVVERRIHAHQPEILRLFRAMVPCPYFFEDIEMRRSDAGVHLALRYRDQVREPAEPRLFLSEAQANVLALAVFLSFACSQRWSRLQTILLDDPVQHLDDLDAVAFLDNLRAVALQRRRQVIVSTCDQNLYLLMIRKFRAVDKEGIRFRGVSLLENGGSAPEVVYDVGGPGPRTAVA